MATIVAAVGGGNWTTGSTWVGGVAPTAADDAQIPLGAGNITINSGALCRSADFATYTGTVTHNAAATLTIGDATAGLSSVALRMVSGMTYNASDAITSRFSFVSTSATQQTVDFAGKTTGDVTFNAASNGSWQMTGAHVQGATATMTFTKGTLDVNGQTCTWGLFVGSGAVARALTMGAAAITIAGASATAWDFSSVGSLTFTCNTSTITFTGAGAGLSGGGQTFGTVAFTGSGTATIAGANTFAVLTRTGTAVKTDKFDLSANQVVTTTLNLNGNSIINRVLIESDTLGTARTFTITAATVSSTFADYRDITFTVSTNLSASVVGDCGGNTNITFTTAAPKYWVGGTGSWSDATNHWATSPGGAANAANNPLPQDNVFFDASSFSGASQTATNDMPRMCKSIDASAVTNSPTLTFSLANQVLYGSLTLAASMTFTASATFIFEGRGSFTVTMAGQVWGNISMTIQMIGGTLTCQDACGSTSGGGIFVLTNGTFDANNFNISFRSFTITGTAARGINMGSGTWAVTAGSGSPIWNAAVTTNLTFNAQTSTISLTNSSNTKSFDGGGLTYNNITVASGGQTNVARFTGSNTFNKFTINAGRWLQFTEGTTTTINELIAVGVTTVLNSGMIRFLSVTSTNQHTFSKSGGVVSCDYLHITDNNATGGATWYAGSHSVKSSNVTGWIFSGAPQGAGFGTPGKFGSNPFGMKKFGRGAFAG